MNLKCYTLIIFMMVALGILGQPSIWIKPNKGQWHENVAYKIGIPGGDLFLENNGFTYQFHNGADFIHEHNHADEHLESTELFKSHVIKTTFLGANKTTKFKESIPSTHVENYILGNDPSKWVNSLTLYNSVQYQSIYPGIDLHIYEQNQTLKYDYIIAPNTNTEQLQIKYEGQNSLEIENGQLNIHTTFGMFSESKPIAYQMIHGEKKIVLCNYTIDKDIISFEFPEGYSNSDTLVIDPILLFSTFTGSSADNWGMTACPDVNQKLIAAGIVFGSGYPTSTGAQSTTFNGGQVDIGLTKFNALGTGIEFSTYIGGTGAETPHSIIVNDANQIFLMGATSSSNFPIPPNAYQPNFAGGTLNTNIDGILFTAGTDLYAIKLNPTGTTIQNGTFLGGTGNDGVVNLNNGGANIAYNYGDQLRGEIIVDQNSNVYISSTTSSTDFPTNNGFSTTLNGSQDAVFVKLNNIFSNLLYGTYIGGSGLESGNSIQIGSNGDLYMAGGTTSSNFPFTSGQINPSFLGGSTDGYVLRLEAPNYANPIATYLGTNDYDQAYFVQLDLNDKVYIYGQSKGNYPVTTGKYVNPNSGQFIHKMNSDLSTTEWSSVFGGGTGDVEISPTAFLVSDCYEIYIAGWGGLTNSSNSSASNSTTNGFPTTSDAYQDITGGSNFYLALFTPDMLALKYATFMGNPTSTNDHVDGGTCRFDKSGKIYHAVCAACSSTGSFPTTPGAYSTTNGSTNCNMAGFVFDLSKIEATLGVPIPITCLPNATIFTNSSINGNTFMWYFGDGDSSSVFSPSHLYANPGIYDVILIVSDSNGCYTPDTAFTQVEIILPVYEAYVLEDTICPGTSVQVIASGGTDYVWGPPLLFNNPYLFNPILTIDNDTTITVEISSVCGITSLTVDVWTFDLVGGAGPDTTICTGQSTEIWATGGGSYLWNPPLGLSDPLISNPIATVTQNTQFKVYITTPDQCHFADSLYIFVDQGLPNPKVQSSADICFGSNIQLTASGALTYEWSPNYNISNTQIPNPIVAPAVDTTYIVSFTNACGTSLDMVDVYVHDVKAITRPDTSICPEEPISLWATGGIYYEWYPTVRVADYKEANTIATPVKSTYYTVTVSDDYGCEDSTGFYVTVFDLPKITLSTDIIAVAGDIIPIWADGNGEIEWFPKSFITCDICPETEVYPPSNTNYTAVLTNENGCKVQGDVLISFEPLIYVPNVFTPDGNDYNNTFKAITQNIEQFEMTIYNRWGEIVFKSYDTDGEWDGYYNGRLSQDGLYIWVIDYVDLNGKKEQLLGHVSILK
ncbi:hypothetical protein DNU06_03540 [Putridiphycobacter roseus]|uniref:PKD domain-containing protein n=1 Tax=Putridiphycobacter roseus TaxID=2219161 RepID=A0A2W1NIN6_9FLAO|nr:gliding motility-associated C-terminal domain-containing protein [Putridiphycobacter roseus]PZE18913.1 hypothetical protein DNU06_03540 [Putridiphycobacter roseus]